MTENKTKPRSASVDDFIKGIDNPRRQADAKVILRIFKELYAGLGKYRKSLACLYINKLDDFDLQVLREIIARDYAKTLQT